MQESWSHFFSYVEILIIFHEHLYSLSLKYAVKESTGAENVPVDSKFPNMHFPLYTIKNWHAGEDGVCKWHIEEHVSIVYVNPLNSL